ncbi:GAS domain-containing protein [Nephila pilipes]|uniref:GAS domain-containing protein n=1 Tax=Nephila pilipes TaxID=299642 RepID=A0A8X6QL38_NEPPI|nr:GAS domain-containing protein [Nephila pilipes]
MPPKKEKGENKDKKKEKKDNDYNVNIMNIVELKEYANMLEKNIETLRNYMLFYQKTENNLADVYKKRQEELKLKEKQILAKDIEIEKLLCAVHREIKEKRQRPTYSEFANEGLVDRHAAETASKLEKNLIQHQDEKSRLKSKVLEKERELEAEGKKIRMGRMAALEKHSKKLRDVDDYERDLLEKTIKAFVAMLEEGSQMNRLALNSIQNEALENRRSVEQKFRNDCTSYKEKLHEYYKKITKKDLETIKDLESEIKKLETAIQMKQLKLQEIQKQNALLKVASYQKGSTRYKSSRSKIDSKTKLKLQVEAKIDRLKKENEVLLEEIRNAEEDTVQLRRNFTRGLCKVRQSADMKITFLERKLKVSLKTGPSTTENTLTFKSNDSSK